MKDAIKVLFVNGCIRKNSRTFSLCEKYISYLKNHENYIVKECKLSEMNLQPLCENTLNERDRDIKTNDFSKEEYNLAKDFKEADMIIIGAPYWDCSYPAILKLYFEHICVSKITFDYGEDGKPIKKCNANKLVYITTSGGFIRENSGVQIMIEEMGAFFKIEEVKFYSAQGLDIYPDKVEEIINKTYKDITKDI